MEETDMCIQSIVFTSPAQPHNRQVPSAKLMGPEARQALAVEALAGTQPIADLAEERETF
jgi:hypothetical protein